MRSPWLIVVSFALLAPNAWPQTVAVPPAANRSAAKAQSSARLAVPAGAPTYAIDLSVPSAEEEAQLQRRSDATGRPAIAAKRHVRAIGFSRKVPDGDRSLTAAALPWQPLADGGKAAQIVVRSPGAAALRLSLRMASSQPGLSVRFQDSTSQVYGPFTAAQIAEAKSFWSPVLEGDSATLEIQLAAGVAPQSVDLRMPRISHLVAAGLSLLKSEPVQDIGRAGACEIDIACAATPAAEHQALSVAKLVYTDVGGTFLCTGTLLNDSVASNTPYLYTASHCIDSQEAASSLVTYWFFDAVSCGSRAAPAYVTLNGGATLLGRSVDSDWALVRLNDPPPAQAVFSAWRADALGDGSAVAVEHHPNGDLKKISQGTMPSYFSFSDGTSFSSVRYSSGSTEPGSSGAGLLTPGNGGGFYELRGGLFAGNVSCSSMGGIDVYSRLDVALPLLAQYLTPDAANPNKKVVVVEYYYAGFDDYFITANPLEIQGLDGGAHPGWVRTGLTFLAYTDPALAPPGTQPVCRFYLLPQFGDSHFYSAVPAECAATAAKFAGSWVEEAAALFYIQVPDPNSGACPANTRPVYRFLNRTNQIHHRYTAEVDVRNCMYYGFNSTPDKDVDCSAYVGSWTQEGYGTPPNAPVMCAPAS